MPYITFPFEYLTDISNPLCPKLSPQKFSICIFNILVNIILSCMLPRPEILESLIPSYLLHLMSDPLEYLGSMDVGCYPNSGTSTICESTLWDILKSCYYVSETQKLNNFRWHCVWLTIRTKELNNLSNLELYFQNTSRIQPLLSISIFVYFIH
jgi:hypothetical protein